MIWGALLGSVLGGGGGGKDDAAAKAQAALAAKQAMDQAIYGPNQAYLQATGAGGNNQFFNFGEQLVRSITQGGGASGGLDGFLMKLFGKLGAARNNPQASVTPGSGSRTDLGNLM